MRSKLGFILLGLVVVLLVVCADQSFAQCAMCRANAESSLKNNSGSIAKGLNSGILYLMGIPYLLLAFIFRNQLKTLWVKYGFKFKSKAKVS